MVHDKSNSIDLYVFVMQAEADSLSWNGAIKLMFVFLGCSAKFCIRSWGRLHWKQKSTSQSSKECVKLALLFTPCQNTHTLSRTRYRTRTLAHALSLSLNHLFFHPPRKFSLFNATEANRAFCLSSIVGRKTSSQSSRKLFRLLDWFDLENLELVFLSFFHVLNCVPWLKEHQK